MNNAFLKSYQTLLTIYDEQAFSSIALNKTLQFCKAQDKALITKLVYGVLEQDIKLQYVVSKYVKKLPKQQVLLLLKMGVYCLTNLSLPVYTVVNDIAELSKVLEDKHIVGFVNATLKNVSKTVAQFSDYPADELECLSVLHSYPLWALKKLVKDYGKEVAKQIVCATSEYRSTLRLAPRVGAQDWQRQNNCSLQQAIFEDSYYAQGALPPLDNTFTVQSLSSMAVSRVAAALLPPNGAFLDSCSAPGGKAVYLKQLRPDVAVTACDLHQHRVQLINSYASRMGVDVATCCKDMTQFVPQWQNAYDAVLCDVPCSGFGVLNNRPDIKLFRKNEDISTLMKLQYAILCNCSNYVKAGGHLVYSTCTLFDNENCQNVRKFLKEHPNFRLGTISLPQFPLADGASTYQFLPHKDGVQGFFVAVLTKIGN